MELLDRHSDGVIALTGCLQSRFCQRLVDDNPAEARAHADELMRRLRRRQRLLRGSAQRARARRTRPTRASSGSPARSAARWWAPPTSTTCGREDYDNHSALLCVQTKSTLAGAQALLRHERVLPQGLGGDGGVVRALARGGAHHAGDRGALRGGHRAGQDADPALPDARTARTRAPTCAAWPRRACAAATATRRRRRRSSGSRWSSRRSGGWASTPTS